MEYYQKINDEKYFGVIYQITNCFDKKIYIGQTIKNIVDRFKEHKYSANKGSNLYLHNAMRKYGAEKFNIEIIDVANSKEELDALEQDYIYLLNSMAPNGYNLSVGGEGVQFHDAKFIENMKINNPGFRPEVRLLLSQKSKGRKFFYNPKTSQNYRILPDDIRIKEYELLPGRIMDDIIVSDETKARMSASAINRKATDVTKQKISEALRKRERKVETYEKAVLTRKQNYKEYHYYINNITGEVKTFKVDECIPEYFSKYHINDTKRKNISDSLKNKKHCYNPLTGEKKMADIDKLPAGFVFGHIGYANNEERNKKISESKKNKKWFHNPETAEKIQLKINEPIPAGFIAGMGHRKK
jgi:group I intron endonuclease